MAANNDSVCSVRVGVVLLRIFALLSATLLLGVAGCAPQRADLMEAVNGAKRADEQSSRAQVQSFRPPAAEEWQLPNGLTVLFLEDQELPLVQGTLYLRGGTLLEGPDETGELAALGYMLRQGGAGTLSADELDTALEKLSASISSSFGSEFGTISFYSLSSDFERVMELFSDVVQRPRFEQSRLTLWKGKSLESIRRRIDDPGTVASISFNQLLYGDEPLGRVLGPRDVERITRKQLREKHSRYVRPDGAIFALSGAVDRARVAAAVERLFAGWSARGSALPEIPDVRHRAEPGVYFVPGRFSQSTIYMGHLGVPRLTPDYLDIEVFNSVFGHGGFGSRLMRRIRSDLGLAYGTFGGIVPAVVQGRNLVMVQTKSESTGAAVQEALQVLVGLQRAPVPEAEIQEAKDSLINSFVFRFDSLSEAVQRQAILRLLNYPHEYDATYIPGIASVGPEEIQRVAQRRWDPERFVVLVVGNEQAYESLQALMQDPPQQLKGLPLRRVTFDYALRLPER